MNYYKVIANNAFVGVGCSDDLRRRQKKHNILLVSDENHAEFIQINEKLYWDWWLAPADRANSIMATVVNIDKEEYDRLVKAVEDGEDIPVEEETKEEQIIPDPIEEATLDYVKANKVAELSRICNQTIIEGFDVALSDGQEHHFSLSTQDQLNLISLSSMLSGGMDSIPYHADGEMCVFFPAKDIMTIVEAATAHKTYHVTYFNSLREYVNSMDNIEDVYAVVYGVEIPEEYQSDVLKALLGK